MLRAWTILLIMASCHRGSKCNDAIKQLAGPQLGAIAAACTSDHWTDAQLACVGRATSWTEVDACSLTDEQRAHLASAKAGADPVGAATASVHRYADAYRPWHADHPDTICPAILQDLQRYTPIDPKDPWGHDYDMLCGVDLPRGVHGIAVVSAGPDGVERTADDVTSWK